MDFDTRDDYVAWIKTMASKGAGIFGWGSMGPRPQGSELLDKNLRVLDIGIERSERVFERLSALKFGYKDRDSAVIKSLKRPGYEFSAYLITNGSEVIQNRGLARGLKTSDFFNGWDSSFHNANWNGLSAIVGYGSTPKEAEAHRDEMVSKLIPAGDPAIKRFKLRRLVRDGD